MIDQALANGNGAEAVAFGVAPSDVRDSQNPPKPQKVTTKTVEVDPVRVDVTVDVKRGRWRRG